MRKSLLKLSPNRVRRNYLGGAGIDAMHGLERCVDTDRPEEWIGSMEEASNPGLEVIEHEGLQKVGDRYLRDIVDEEREFYLGADGKGKEWKLSFLFKILDSAMRLHVQVHPTTEFANRVLGRPYGKLECYYILSVREGIEPSIWLGFQHAPTREEWKRIIEEQDKDAMAACFEKIAVKPGEVWYIPGGVPHAIGRGITMLEIMEPSDLVVRCEFERERIVVPPEARFMGHDLEFCLDVFDYGEMSREEVRKRCKVEPEVLYEEEGLRIDGLVGSRLTKCFNVRRFKVEGSHRVRHDGKFSLAVVVEGSVRIRSGEEDLELRRGDSFMIAAGAEELELEGTCEFVAVEPGSAMGAVREGN